MLPFKLPMATTDLWNNDSIRIGVVPMEPIKESVELAQKIPSGEDIIKTQIGLKRGMIAGVLILILVLAAGVLLGYSIGTNIATEHYSALLDECHRTCLPLIETFK
jgi:hypothetical protein